MPRNDTALLADADRLLRLRRPAEAQRVCAAILAAAPDNRLARRILARARQAQGDWQGMYDQVSFLLDCDCGGDAGDVQARLMQAEALVSLGRIAEARAAIARIKPPGDAPPRAGDADLLARIAEIETGIGDHRDAHATLSRAHRLSPVAPALLYNLASAEIALGKLAEAEAHLDAMIAARPGDGDAWYNRSTLRRQTPERNHIAALTSRIAQGSADPGETIGLCHALAKEYEDLGEYDRSFDALARGAAMRRRHMRYRVNGDIETMQAIAATFDRDWMSLSRDGCAQARPVFVLGLPRSGTTLVERILASHHRVDSVGEVHDLPLAIMRICGPAGNKAGLVARSAEMDFARLGTEYWRGLCERTRRDGADTGPIVDKTPLNFLYIGLILKAMPNARILHVDRDPMDVGYAMFKTLFRMGYPFSYDLEEIGRYIAAKRMLMDHWRRVAPGRILDIRYEALVDAPETHSRAMIAALGLDWDENCLDFHANPTPSATASAAQVRRPVYRSSVAQWRRYEHRLDPLKKALAQ